MVDCKRIDESINTNKEKNCKSDTPMIGVSLLQCKMSIYPKQHRKEKSLESSRLSLAGEEGIEPPLTVLETVALPLN